jgi:chitin disaccharide deacetylase
LRLLIVNADDFGLNDAATDAIIDNHSSGAVTSTTLLVNAPGCERAIALAADHPDLGIGLHFNLTWGAPLSDPRTVPALVSSSGKFLGRTGLAVRLLSGRVPTEQIRREFTAQLDRICQLGIKPSHIDSHQHIHSFGQVFATLASYCSVHAIPMRVPWVGRRTGSSSWLRKLKRESLALILNRSVDEWRDRIICNDGLGSLFDLGEPMTPVTEAQYRAILENASGNSFELMVHPATHAEAMLGFTRIGDISEAEYRFLAGVNLARIASDYGFILGNYRDLAARKPSGPATPPGGASTTRVASWYC